MSEKSKGDLKSKGIAEKSAPNSPKTSEETDEKDGKKIGEKSAIKSVKPTETSSSNKGAEKSTLPDAPFLLKISPEKLVVPPSEPLKITIKNPTEDTQTLRCQFDSYYYLVDFKDAKSSGQHGVTPAAAYGCYELGPGESCSMTIRTTDRIKDMDSINIYDCKRNAEKRRRLKYPKKPIDIAYYNYDRPEGFLKIKHQKKGMETETKWAVREEQLCFTDDIDQKIDLRVEEINKRRSAKRNREPVNRIKIDPELSDLMKFYRMKSAHKATRTHQKWREVWGETLVNNDNGTHRVFEPESDVREFVQNKENYNKTLGSEADNIVFWEKVFAKEYRRDPRNPNEKEEKKDVRREKMETRHRVLSRNSGFAKFLFTSGTLEEATEKAEKFLMDQKEEDWRIENQRMEQLRIQRMEEEKKEKEKKKKPCCSIM
ncbi:hypothetical protein GCK72_004539 [Caenorhabditis remanei]|uniref:Uncharacterized protein n=1 Tax=Caenorhabditis remanei TaxID=31234 RepID=A0A6A5H9W0_CAERE|nr:hypothetical protein GCK72_004539 [Caenorhabditis remanei]KAF1764590.1 hypothetical protein GCK72_004539 [Caenorhabditis remanei]